MLQVQISPDQQRIVSVGAEGAILFWNSPPELSRDMKKDGYVPKVGLLACLFAPVLVMSWAVICPVVGVCAHLLIAGFVACCDATAAAVARC